MIRNRRRRTSTTGKNLDFRFGLVVSDFHGDITGRLLEGARACLTHHGVPESHIVTYSCPGAFELPQVAEHLLKTGASDAVICLGAVIRGETPHFEYVSSAAAHGIEQVAIRHGKPVSFGVLTTNTVAQAKARAGGRHGNKGWDAALAALEMADLFQSTSLSRGRRGKQLSDRRSARKRS